MSWTHYSKGAILGVLLAISLVVVGIAAAISTTGTQPEPANVNDTVTMNATVEDPFEGQPDQWTLRADSELKNATYSVEVYEQDRLVVQDGDQGSVNVSLDRSGQTTPDRIEITVTGEVPDDIQYDYQDRSKENYTVLTLTNADTGEQLRSWDGHRYTDGSQEARSAIEDAEAAIDKLDDPSEDVQNRLDEAISAYNAGNFDNAVSIANDTQSMAEAEREEEKSSGLPLTLVGGVVLVLLLAVGGGAYYWQTQQQQDYKLQ